MRELVVNDWKPLVITSVEEIEDANFCLSLICIHYLVIKHLISLRKKKTPLFITLRLGVGHELSFDILVSHEVQEVQPTDH